MTDTNDVQDIYKKKTQKSTPSSKHLPHEIESIVKAFAKPFGIRLDWRTQPTPSCMAIYRSNEWRDYRTDVIRNGLMGACAYDPSIIAEIIEDVGNPELANENTTWETWCRWNGILFEYDLYHDHDALGPNLEYVDGYEAFGVDVFYERRSGYWQCSSSKDPLIGGWNKEKNIGESWWLHDDGSPTGSKPNVWGKWYR